MLVAGLGLLGSSAYDLHRHQQADSQVTQQWFQLMHQVASQRNQPQPSSPSPSTYMLYARVSFPAVSLAGVAVAGDANTLHYHDFVFWDKSVPPGGSGNSVWFFHREFGFVNINQLAAGDKIVVQTKNGKTYTYKVTQMVVVQPTTTWPLDPTKVGVITLVTCTPLWVDSERLIIRGTLVPNA